MKALFIGGTGNISTAVSRLAVAQGVELTLLNRGQRPVEVAGAESLVADINDEAAAAEAENKRNAARERKRTVNEAVCAICEAQKIKPDDEGRYRFTVDGYVVVLMHLDRCVVRRVSNDGEDAAPRRGRKRKG